MLKYGAFLQTVFDFLIIALAIFLAVKLMNRLKRKEEEAEEPATPSNAVTNCLHPCTITLCPEKIHTKLPDNAFKEKTY